MQITSQHNELFRTLKRTASDRKFRQLSQKTILGGFHIVESYLKHFQCVDYFILPTEQTQEVSTLLSHYGSNNRVLHLTTRLYSQIEVSQTPVSIMALVDIPKIVSPQSENLILLLERIQDPGNLGSILRTALAANVDTVYLSEDCADIWSPKTLRGGQGAQFALAIVENADLRKIASEFHGQVIATYTEGQSLFQTSLKKPTALIVGNEGQGLSSHWRDLADIVMTIPMTKQVESLNVATATAICLFERTRQLYEQHEDF